jgi:hypothetical protein
LKVGDDHFEMTAISAFAGAMRAVVEDRHAHPRWRWEGARIAPGGFRRLATHHALALFAWSAP